MEINTATLKTLKDIPFIEIGGSQILGTRKNQQDSYGWLEKDNELLAVVCDGMGGLSGGELASKVTVEMILGKFSGIQGECLPPQFFREAVNEADLIVHDFDEDGKSINAGTTIVAVHIKDNKLHWLSVGDSHIYIIRRNEILSVCAEHNYGELLKKRLEAGEISQTEYEADTKRKDALTSYIGIGGVKLMEINDIPLSLVGDDMIILCSDGLFKTLLDADIMRSAFEYKLNAGRCAEYLTETAMKLTKGSQDNTTAIVIHYNGDIFT